MIIEEFNKLLKANIGSDEKLNVYLNLKERINEVIKTLNTTNINMKLKMDKTDIQQVFIEEKYSNNQLKENNITLFKTVLSNLLSPNKALDKYTDYYNEVSQKEFKESRKVIDKFLLEILNIKDIENKLSLIQEDKIMIEDEDIEEFNVINKPKTDVFSSISIFQPSYEILKQIFNTKLVENIEISFINNQEVETRNIFLKTILPQGVGKRDDLRDDHLEPTLKNLIGNIYKVDNQNFNVNIKLDFIMNKKLSFQEEIMFKSYLNKNGINVGKNQSGFVSSVTDFDLIMLLNINKG